VVTSLELAAALVLVLNRNDVEVVLVVGRLHPFLLDLNTVIGSEVGVFPLAEQLA
jgi:hypothetical protein